MVIVSLSHIHTCACSRAYIQVHTYVPLLNIDRQALSQETLSSEMQKNSLVIEWLEEYRRYKDPHPRVACMFLWERSKQVKIAVHTLTAYPHLHRPPFFPSLLTLNNHSTCTKHLLRVTALRAIRGAGSVSLQIFHSIMLPLTRQQIPFIAQVFCLLLPVPSISLVITEGAVLSGDRVRHKATGNDVTAGGDSADSYSTLRFLQEDVCMHNNVHVIDDNYAQWWWHHSAMTWGG